MPESHTSNVPRSAETDEKTDVTDTFRTIAFFIGLAVLAFVTFILVHDQIQRNDVIKNGFAAQGVIVRKFNEIKYGSRGGPYHAYSVEFRYIYPNGRMLDSEARIDYTIFSHLDIGQKIPIHVLERSPYSTLMVLDSPYPPHAQNPWGLGIFMVWLIGSLIYAATHRIRRGNKELWNNLPNLAELDVNNALKISEYQRSQKEQEDPSKEEGQDQQ